jgi:hypothetical protein
MLMSRKVRSFAPAVAAALMLATVAAGAARADYPAAVKSACKSDFRKFCPGYGLESRQLRQCMRGAFNQLSARCVEALDRSGERRNR